MNTSRAVNVFFVVLCLVIQLSLTLCDPVDQALLSVVILQARILEWVAMLSFAFRLIGSKRLKFFSPSFLILQLLLCLSWFSFRFVFHLSSHFLIASV